MRHLLLVFGNLLSGMILTLVATPVVSADDGSVTRALTSGGHVLMLRHAYAPGTGDPANFRLDDCSTQRNLDDRGRAQAGAIGDWLRARGVTRARVFSTPVCDVRLKKMDTKMRVAPPG